MRNLELLYAVKKHIKHVNAELFIPTPGASSDAANLLYLYSDSQISSLDLRTNAIEELFEAVSVVSSEYLPLNNEICVATEGGEVIVFNLDTKQFELVTFCEDGIEKMSWSPDQEVITFITKTKRVVVMSLAYEPINETNLDDANFGEREFITVGWGKKETQFHGSEGKQAAKQKSEPSPPKNYEELDQTINVTWRGDSELFAVSYVGASGRMFKVFNKEGVLQCTSERLNGLGSCIAWKPTGSVIAVPHRLPNKSTIGLFEKNGLRHREIILPFNFDDEPIRNLAWSGDSDILSIETKCDNKSKLYVYTMCNYHWYLKQYLSFDGKISQFVWSSEVNEDKTLHVLLENGDYVVYRWCYTICYSEGVTIHNQSIVSVIDGRNILLTDFRNNVIPPPMSSQVIENSSNINSCGFIKYPKNDNDTNKFFIFDADNQMKIFNMEFEDFQFGKRFKSTKLLSCLKIDNESTIKLSSLPLNINKFLWLTDNSIVYYESYNQDENCSRIGLIKIENDSFKIVDSATIPEIVGSITNLNSNTFLIHLKNGKVFGVGIENDKLNEPKLFTNLPEFHEHIKTVQIHDDSIKLIAYKHNQNLYVNNIKVSSDVTSFFVTTKYVVFTQLNVIKFWKIADDSIVDERKIERGGRLLVIVPFDSRTILQMPRGNLEAINPRVLLLDTIGELLDQLQYAKSMEILRKHRINLNILFDHNPKLFIENIEKFLDEIQNLQWLNLFLSELQNDDFTKTLYKSNYLLKLTEIYPENDNASEKINYICQLLCERMEKRNFTHYMLPIITTYVKVGNLEKALEVIWSEKKKETELLQQNKIFNQQVEQEMKDKKTKSEEALQYLLYLVDVNELYNVALGMYDFGLVLFVANKSQKDPKEYILFLNELKRYEENYRKFKIDEHLKRYERALENIGRCEDDDKFEECLEFVQKHKLYQKALMVFRTNNTRYMKIALCFADYLRSQRKHEEASLMYERGGDLQQAVLSAKHVLDWQRCVMLTKIVTANDADQLRNISLSLIPSLQEHGKYEDAFYLLKELVGDFNKAIECLLNGRFYLKAIFEAKIHEPDLITSTISPHLLYYKDILQINVSSDENLFTTYKKRLLKVRTERAKRDSEQIFEDGVDECDLLSDTTSMNSTRFSGSSRGTGKTFRSSKNRRKHERKLLSLKEGNPFEDIALIDALYNHIMKIMNQQTHIRDTCKALVEINCDDYAKTVQKSLKNLLKLVQDSLDDIWIPEMQTTQQFLNGPNIDYTQMQNEQRYAMIIPQKRFKPQLEIIDWEFEILK